MNKLIDLERYPLDRLDTAAGQRLVKQCIDDLERNGMFTLEGFMRREAIDEILPGVIEKLKQESFFHARQHNIYFDDDIDDIAADHPAMTRVETINHTLCGDQLAEPLAQITSTLVELDRDARRRRAHQDQGRVILRLHRLGDRVVDALRADRADVPEIE